MNVTGRPNSEGLADDVRASSVGARPGALVVVVAGSVLVVVVVVVVLVVVVVAAVVVVGTGFTTCGSGGL